MKCIIPGSNIKVFGRAVHTLSRIGDELYVEPSADGLALRTVNSSRSAYAVFNLSRPFFTQLSADGNVSRSNHAKCKVSLKACLFPFRSLSSLDKTVERCRITIDDKKLEMVIHMDCKHKVGKTYTLPFIECESLQAVYSATGGANALCADSRMLHEALLNFQTGQEEVTLSFTDREVGIRNFVDDQPEPSRAIHTALKLSRSEFDSVTRAADGADCEVTFCLRELRAVLQFTEPLRLPVTANFDRPGRPIVFCARCGGDFEAHFVLATLAERDEEPPPQEASRTSTDGISSGDRTRSRRFSRDTTEKRSAEAPSVRSSAGASVTLDRGSPTLRRHSPVTAAATCTATPPALSAVQQLPADGRRPRAAAGQHAVSTEELPSYHQPLSARSIPADCPGTPRNTSTPLKDQSRDHRDVVCGLEKRTRFLFPRCFNQTLDPVHLGVDSTGQRILAPDSDTDD